MRVLGLARGCGSLDGFIIECWLGLAGGAQLCFWWDVVVRRLGIDKNTGTGCTQIRLDLCGQRSATSRIR